MTTGNDDAALPRSPLVSRETPRVRIGRWSTVACVVLGAQVNATTAAAQESAPTRPQANAGIAIGAARVAVDNDESRTLLDLGVRADVLFGRNGPHAWGAGPAIGVGTYRFKDLELQAGAALLVPVHEYLPIVVTAGPYARRAGAWDPGAFASIFWGSRSFNYDGSYGMVAGIVLEGRAGFGDLRERTILVALHLDLQVILLPALMLINAAR